MVHFISYGAGVFHTRKQDLCLTEITAENGKTNKNVSDNNSAVISQADHNCGTISRNFGYKECWVMCLGTFHVFVDPGLGKIYLSRTLFS